MDPLISDIFTLFEKSVISLPAAEVMLLLGLLTFCLFFSHSRIGLLLAFACTYRWGWTFFHATFQTEYRGLLMAYTAFGALVLILAIIDIIVHRFIKPE